MTTVTATRGAGVPRPRAGRRPALTLAAVLGVAATGVLGGCAVPPELLFVRSGLDSLRAVVDTMAVRDSLSLEMLREMRADVSEQREILLSTRATTGSTTREVYEQMGRLEGKLDEVMGRFQQVTERAPVTRAPGGADANQIYDQAAQDLTQGRYTLSLQGFREFVARYPESDLADNAQYGVGECQFALSRFDSAAVAYAEVEARYPQGDKVPAALYKLAICQEKLDRAAQARVTLENLVERFPLSGEAHLARERLGETKRR